MGTMKKDDAIKIFGSQAELSRALGLTRGRISQWDEDLDLAQTDRVIGAACRMGLAGLLPEKYRPFVDRSARTKAA